MKNTNSSNPLSNHGARSSSLPASSDDATRRLIDAKGVGLLLSCHWQTVLRHADAGLIPWGLKLGALRRWDAAEIDKFIRDGCRPLRPRKRI